MLAESQRSVAAGRATGLLGWPRRGWVLVSVWVGTLFLLFAAMLVLHGLSDKTMGFVARSAVRSSLIAFCLAFGASPLHRLFPGPVSRWLLENRRYLGFCVFCSHTLFVGSNVARVFLFYGGDFLHRSEPSVWVYGGSTYLLIVLMGVTSFPATRRLLGERLWRGLHWFGGYSLLIGFVYSYVPRALHATRYVPLGLLVLALAGLRFAAFLKGRPLLSPAVLGAILFWTVSGYLTWIMLEAGIELT